MSSWIGTDRACCQAHEWYHLYTFVREKRLGEKHRSWTTRVDSVSNMRGCPPPWSRPCILCILLYNMCTSLTRHMYLCVMPSHHVLRSGSVTVLLAQVKRLHVHTRRR